MVHNLQSRKSAKLSKTWEKLKSGLWGWKVRIRVEYSCKYKLQPDISLNLPGPSASLETAAVNGRGWERGESSVQGTSGGRLPG